MNPFAWRRNRSPPGFTADEPGLGKSLIALLCDGIERERQEGGKTLVVCPSTLRRNWEKEIRKMTNLEPRVLDGTPKKRDAIIDAFRDATATC